MQSHSRMTLKIFFFLLVIVSVSVSAEMPQPYKSLISKYNFKKDSYSFVVKNLTNPKKKVVIYIDFLLAQRDIHVCIRARILLPCYHVNPKTCL